MAQRQPPPSEKTPQEIVREKLWTVTTNAVILAAVFGAGIYVGNLMWGEAPALRKKNAQKDEQIIRLRNKQTELEGKAAVFEGKLEACQQDLARARTAAPPASPAEAGAAPEPAEELPTG